MVNFSSALVFKKGHLQNLITYIFIRTLLPRLTHDLQYTRYCILQCRVYCKSIWNSGPPRAIRRYSNFYTVPHQLYRSAHALSLYEHLTWVVLVGGGGRLYNSHFHSNSALHSSILNGHCTLVRLHHDYRSNWPRKGAVLLNEILNSTFGHVFSTLTTFYGVQRENGSLSGSIWAITRTFGMWTGILCRVICLMMDLAKIDVCLRVMIFLHWSKSNRLRCTVISGKMEDTVRVCIKHRTV